MPDIVLEAMIKACLDYSSAPGNRKFNMVCLQANLSGRLGVKMISGDKLRQALLARRDVEFLSGGCHFHLHRAALKGQESATCR